MTNAELAILGLIQEEPRHGYDIEQVIEERGMRDWAEVAFSSIYYILRKLEKRGLIRSQIGKGPGKGPARKTYHISGLGREAWQEATLTALATPATGSDPFLLGLAGVDRISAVEILPALRKHLQTLQIRREEIQLKWSEEGQDNPLNLDAVFDYSAAKLDMRIKWLEEFIGKQDREPNEEGQYHLPF